MEAAKGKPELRKDSINNRWVIFSPARSRRPSDFKSNNPNNNNNNNQSDTCPFCIGRERQCAPEIFRFSRDSPDNWTLRVIQNLYPALSRELEGEGKIEVGPGRARLGGFGFHDVVIESPVHSVHLPDLEAEEIGDVFLAYKKRILEIMHFPSIQYVQVFKNHGASAGASMSHSHSQLLGIPVIPPTVAARISSMKENFEQTGKCSLCEIRQDELLIEQSTHFISIAPFASSYPFEIWIVPREHSSHFYGIDSDKAIDLGRLLKLILQKMALQLNNPPYNFMVHSSPLHATREQLPYSHWYLQIVPQLSVKAGFEMGSGCDINPVFPEDAAKILRELSLPK